MVAIDGVECISVATYVIIWESLGWMEGSTDHLSFFISFNNRKVQSFKSCCGGLKEQEEKSR